MPKISAYHSTIAIRDGSGYFMVESAWDDWYPDHEILAFLAIATGAQTAGGVVEGLRGGIKKRVAGLISYGAGRKIESPPPSDALEWDEGI